MNPLTPTSIDVARLTLLAHKKKKKTETLVLCSDAECCCPPCPSIPFPPSFSRWLRWLGPWQRLSGKCGEFKETPASRCFHPAAARGPGPRVRTPFLPGCLSHIRARQTRAGWLDFFATCVFEFFFLFRLTVDCTIIQRDLQTFWPN